MVRGARPFAAGRPEPEHDDHGGQVLQQQGDADREPGHGVEVEELAGGHADESEQQDGEPVVPELVPASAQRRNGRDGQDQRRPGEAGRDGRAGRPAGLQQRLGKGAGEAEDGRGEQRDAQAGARKPAAGPGVRRRAGPVPLAGSSAVGVRQTRLPPVRSKVGLCS